MTGKTTNSLTGQIPIQSGHCPLTGRFFEHWALVWRVNGVPTSQASTGFDLIVGAFSSK